MVKSIAGRLFLPRNWSPFLRCFRSRNGVTKAADDATLKLYGQLLPGGFLNYGYSEDPAVPPEKMNIAGVQEAQIRYGERLADLVLDKENRVLDAGCGMGGLVGLLLKRGLQPTALTPNRTQIRRVRGDFPNVPMIEGRLEEIPLPEFHHTFGTVITSESFQYMKLPVALDVIDQVGFCAIISAPPPRRASPAICGAISPPRSINAAGASCRSRTSPRTFCQPLPSRTCLGNASACPSRNTSPNGWNANALPCTFSCKT